MKRASNSVSGAAGRRVGMGTLLGQVWFDLVPKDEPTLVREKRQEKMTAQGKRKRRVPCATVECGRVGEAGSGADVTGGRSRDPVMERPLCSASELGPFPEGPVCVSVSWDLRF